jgi:hypothetical protein
VSPNCPLDLIVRELHRQILDARLWSIENHCIEAAVVASPGYGKIKGPPATRVLANDRL